MYTEHAVLKYSHGLPHSPAGNKHCSQVAKSKNRGKDRISLWYVILIMMILHGDFQYPGSFSRIYIGNWKPTVFCLTFVTFPKHTSARKWRVCPYFHLSLQSLQAFPVLFQSFSLSKQNWKRCTYSKRRALNPTSISIFFVEISEGKYFFSACQTLSTHVQAQKDTCAA